MATERGTSVKAAFCDFMARGKFILGVEASLHFVSHTSVGPFGKGKSIRVRLAPIILV
jgi:hypothetical protein